MPREWFYQRENEAVGPFSDTDLRFCAQKGIINRTSLVRVGQAGNWTPALRVKGLFPETQQPPPLFEDVPSSEFIEETPAKQRVTTPSYRLGDRIGRLVRDNRKVVTIASIVAGAFIVWASLTFRTSYLAAETAKSRVSDNVRPRNELAEEQIAISAREQADAEALRRVSEEKYDWAIDTAIANSSQKLVECYSTYKEIIRHLQELHSDYKSGKKGDLETKLLLDLYRIQWQEVTQVIENFNQGVEERHRIKTYPWPY